MFTTFHSSLTYAQVRDFAYPLAHPLHYGPPAESSRATSGQSTPAFDYQRRLSDPPNQQFDTSREWATDGIEQLPQTAYTDPRGDHGPPYSEDEDLQSPVVVSSRYRQWAEPDSRRGDQRAYLTRTNGDGSETYYVAEDNEMADGPGGEIVTYGPDDARNSKSMLFPRTYHSPREKSMREDALRQSQYSETSLGPGQFHSNESRYSRDYQFTIASPDEEMHGKAVALFDFQRENENELPLVEGQVIWVSYRHGQGWLVAEDPKTGESGLVPEEYVRLLRDIEGGWVEGGDNGAGAAEAIENREGDNTMTMDALPNLAPESSTTKEVNTNGDKHPPVVSTFSTSRKDLERFEHPILGTQSGQQPPLVEHYQNKTTTPLTSPALQKSEVVGKGMAKDEADSGKGKDSAVDHRTNG
jgi:hypothetical protein